jgi:putative ABC transport system ATP-binding protein
MKKNFLIIKDLTKIYNGEGSDRVTALNNLAFSVNEGEFITIVGSNAAGKSTLFNLIAGSLLPTSGDIVLDGQSICNLPEFKKARFISCVKQNPNESVINSMSIAENLAMIKLKGKIAWLRKGVKQEWRQEFVKVLKPLGLGLERRLDDKVNNLSGGQKQALALLMATLIKPKLLLLDEHTAALDPKVSRTILEITSKIVKKNKVTTLMITHNIHQAIEYGERLIFLDWGKIGFDISGDEKRLLEVSSLESNFRGVNHV